jgi:hypothetical protein
MRAFAANAHSAMCGNKEIVFLTCLFVLYRQPLAEVKINISIRSDWLIA